MQRDKAEIGVNMMKSWKLFWARRTKEKRGGSQRTKVFAHRAGLLNIEITAVTADEFLSAPVQAPSKCGAQFHQIGSTT